MNITLDDASPQFLYFSSKGTWGQNHTGDPQTDKYYKKTFTGTYTDGDYVSLTFNGTAITIYGAKRPNHGTYSTQLDGGSTSLQIGYSATAQFQVPIFSAKSLSSDEEHTIILKNLPSETSSSGTNNTQWWLDIDYAVITTSTTGKVWTTSYDDQSPEISYIGSGWSSDTSADASYFNESAHITQTIGDSVSLSFNGSSVQVFGGLYLDHGNYSATLDGGKTTNYNGTFYDLQAGTSLFQASGLEEGVHSLLLTNVGQGPKGKYFDVDYMIVNTTIDPSLSGNSTDGNTTSTSTASPLASDSSSSLNSGAIAGYVVGGVVGLALVVVLAWFLFRRNSNKLGGPESPYLKPGRLDSRMDLNGDEVKPFMSNDPSAQPSHASSTADPYHNPAPDYFASDTTDPRRSSSYPLASLGRESERDEHAPFLSNSMNNAEGGPLPVPGAGIEPGATNNVPTKSAGVALPYTARPTFSHSLAPNTFSPPPSHQPSSPDADLPNPHLPYASVTEENRRHSQSSLGLGRKYVPGREQDLGPVGAEFQDPEAAVVLPPDYSQATEPLPGQRRDMR
ncbi:hypothetical protein IAR50_002600 [Cryptococcus sp. DSM 104548]